VLKTDVQKSLPPQLLARNTGAPFAMLRAYRSAKPGLSGLGLNTESLIMQANQFNPEPISRTAIQVIDSIARFLGIGKGRQEADQIVPYQNQIHYEVLAPIAEAVNADYREYLCQSQLQTMLDALDATENWWLSFLHDTEWSDGRAAVQAEQTLEFLFADQRRKLQELLIDAPWSCTVTPPEVIPIGGGSTTGGRTGGGSTQIVRAGFGPSTLASALPWVLGGAFLLMLPKLGKYQR